jgi:hypothetical protein
LGLLSSGCIPQNVCVATILGDGPFGRCDCHEGSAFRHCCYKKGCKGASRKSLLDAMGLLVVLFVEVSDDFYQKI